RKANQAAMADDPRILIITGVTGSGKSTIATALARRLHWQLKEAADLHPASDVGKMHAGHPLDDRDEWHLLERLAGWIDGWRQAGQSGVITYTMLKRSYRDFLTSGRPEVRVVFLHGNRALIAARLAACKAHIPSTSLLDTQFAVLEGPEPDEDSIRVDVDRAVEDIVAVIVHELETPLESRSSVVARDRGEPPATPQIKPELEHATIV